MNEVWRAVPGSDMQYSVSDMGRVKSNARVVECRDYPRRIRDRVLNPWLSKGYPTVNVVLHGRRATRQVHNLVLMAFVGPRPDGMEGCHNDGDPTNNRLSNLRWDTSSANKYDIVKHGNHHWARKTTCPRGHDLSGDNLTPSSLTLGRRQCRACNQAYGHIKNHPGADFRSTADRMYARIKEQTK